MQDLELWWLLLKKQKNSSNDLFKSLAISTCFIGVGVNRVVWIAIFYIRSIVPLLENTPSHHSASPSVILSACLHSSCCVFQCNKVPNRRWYLLFLNNGHGFIFLPWKAAHIRGLLISDILILRNVNFCDETEIINGTLLALFGTWF